jgi:hypothetical protein
MNEETRLLEANRKRLLTQQDWVGIDPSKPVHLRFLSSKDKEKIGKRRRIPGRHGAALRQKNDVGPDERQLHPAHKAFAGPFERNNDMDNIRIRIGTDALTNTYSAQTNKNIQSQASSDPMLFDQEEPAAQQHMENPGFAPPVNAQSRGAGSMSRQTSAIPHANPLTGEKTRGYHNVARLHGPISSRDASEQGSSTYDELEQQSQDATSIHREHESSAAGFRLTHRVQGDERAVHLIFGDSNSSAGSRGRIVSGDSDIGETQPPHEPNSARAVQISHMHKTSNDTEQSAIDEVSAAHAIVDEESWKTCLAIPDGSSSHTDAASEARNSMLHNHPAARNNNEAVTNWSQHATQGDQSHIDTSSVSASLPPLKRGVNKPLSAYPYEGEPVRRGNRVNMSRQNLDEAERNWQAFVFGSDNNSSSQQTHDHAPETPRLKNSENTSSRYLPLSAAVSTVSPPPRNTRFASYMSNDVQDPDTFAPPSTSRATSPPAFHGFVEELSPGGFDEDIAERSVFNMQSVTHASLQNNAPASFDLTSSRIFSGTTTSRNSLDRPTHARDASHTHSTSNKHFAGSSSIYDIPVSDDEALNLVDPDETEWG